MTKKILIELNHSLGDAIGAMPYIEKYVNESDDDVYVKMLNNFAPIFEKTYPNIKFRQERDTENYDTFLGMHYDYNRPLQAGYALQLGFENAPYIRPRVDKQNGIRPIKNKYVTIGIHSTAQLKFWNHPSGKRVQTTSPNWSDLCTMIRKAGYTPVILEKYEMFGVPPHRNGMPAKAQKKIGIPLKETLNFIEHSEFFIGLSSGLSWAAHALGKPVAMISNFSEDWHEFDLATEDYKRITNKSVCHGCWNRINIDYTYPLNEWYWCPRQKGTKRQFECHTSITPEYVFDQIKDWLI